jgi:hypothetical protein
VKSRIGSRNPALRASPRESDDSALFSSGAGITVALLNGGGRYVGCTGSEERKRV